MKNSAFFSAFALHGFHPFEEAKVFPWEAWKIEWEMLFINCSLLSFTYGAKNNNCIYNSFRKDQLKINLLASEWIFLFHYKTVTYTEIDFVLTEHFSHIRLGPQHHKLLAAVWFHTRVPLSLRSSVCVNLELCRVICTFMPIIPCYAGWRPGLSGLICYLESLLLAWNSNPGCGETSETFLFLVLWHHSLADEIWSV